MSESAAGLPTRVFVPLLFVVVVLLTQTIHQTLQIRRQHDLLEVSYAQQAEVLEQARQLRAQLESIAGETAILAEQGNANAVKLRDYLRQQGVTIRPPGMAR